ncbi:MAG: matrixin family metalloprotease [Acidobacteriota bacterium]
MSRRTILTLCMSLTLAVTLLAAATPAHGFRLLQTPDTGQVDNDSTINAVTCTDAGGFLHWNTLDIEWRLNEANQGSGKVISLRNALETWNDVTDAGHVLSYGWTTTAGFGMDGINTVLWDTDDLCTGSCIATTILIVQAGQVVVESDILFRDDRTWTTNGGTFDTQAVLTHELGHSLGIAHTNVTTTPRPTMWAFYDGIGGRTLHEDDRDALRCAYDRYHPCTAAPARPAFISGPNNDLCQGATEIYFTDHIPGAETYRWEVVGHWFNRTTSNPEVSISGHYFTPGTYQLRVRAQNDCGNSAWHTVTIFVLSNTSPACGGCSGRFCF